MLFRSLRHDWKEFFSLLVLKRKTQRDRSHGTCRHTIIIVIKDILTLIKAFGEVQLSTSASETCIKIIAQLL